MRSQKENRCFTPRDGTVLVSAWCAAQLAAAVITLDTLLNILLMLVETEGMIAPAATATNPAMRAYSIKSWPRVSTQIRTRYGKLRHCIQ